MAGFLSGLGRFLVPFGQTVGVGMKRAQISSDLDKQIAGQEAGFNEILKSGGPEMEIWRRAHEAGMSRSAIASAAGGPFGQMLQQAHQRERLKELFPEGMDLSDPTKVTETVWKGIRSGDIPLDEGMKLISTMGAGFKPTGKLGDFLSFKGITPQQWNTMGQEQKAPLQAQFQEFVKKAVGPGSGDTRLVPIFDAKSGTTVWTYEPKSGPAGTSVGLQTPRMGASMQADINQSANGLQRLSQTIDKAKLGDSGVPTWGTYVKMKAGLPVDPTSLDMLGQISVINSTLTGVVMRSWGSRNPAAAEKFISLHVPQVGDSPKLIKDKINQWMQPGGYLDQYRGMAGMPEGMGPLPGGEEPPGAGAGDEWEDVH